MTRVLWSERGEWKEDNKKTQNKNYNKPQTLTPLPVKSVVPESIVHFMKKELKRFKKVLSPDCTKRSEDQSNDERVSDVEDEEQVWSSRESFLKITLHFLKRLRSFSVCLRGFLKQGWTGEVNDEQEVRQIESASRGSAEPETTIKCEDIFKPSPWTAKPIRTVMTKGVAGIVKTVLTQRFTLDWAEDKANQDIQLTLPFTFRELNALRDKKYSLVELVHHFFTETKEAGIHILEELQVLLIFDGLDECRLPLNFHSEILTDATELASVDVLLTNLIMGNLLPSAHLWITTRPAAASQIPPEYVDKVTEVRGFTDPQKEEYFQKRFRDEKQASRIISHITKPPHHVSHPGLLLDHCYCSGGYTKNQKDESLTLTEMYIHFLVVQLKLKNIKYDRGDQTDTLWNENNRTMILSLGKLAFERTSSTYSGVFTQIFKQEKGLYQDKVFCFVHLSVQEFLAALHVHLTFVNLGVNLLAGNKPSFWWSIIYRDKPKLTQLYNCAVNKALQNPNGHLDLFLHFLLGLSLKTNQTLLQGLLTQRGSSSDTNQKTVKYIIRKISENQSPENSINLFHCLNELNDHSLKLEIQQYLRLRRSSSEKHSPAVWSALAFMLLSSEEDFDTFDLKKYFASEEVPLRMLLVVKASNKAL
uniref:NACHT domain-containing protein n=1 Tax=Mola mola TaxID=94237 RepID=A0A3Q3X9Z6_MOLML